MDCHTVVRAQGGLKRQDPLRRLEGLHCELLLGVFLKQNKQLLRFVPVEGSTASPRLVRQKEME